ncbi:ABC transporter permease [Nonomuraea muscovyensis]|uniref:Transport permease protein n=1 Tax=Nonomuraea muscovyensis TaxID=1124761 RepID=A0A7X0CC82_9ACTN|nr:ABC transporter permease [Nonomuraea muscovyensis]MBB6351086.1 ABC-2 type transport system permease protein [Nonomuraea muscovyensis]
MTVAWATLRRSWLVTRRAYPWSYFIGTLLLGVFTMGVAYLGLRAVAGDQVPAEFAGRVGTADYLGYIAVGAAAYMFVVHGILWIGKAMIQEQREGTMGALVVAPARRLPYLLGFAAFAFTAVALEVAVLLGFALLLGVRPAATGAVDAVLAVAGLALAVFGMSVVLSNVMIVAGEAHITQNTVFQAVAVLSGFTFPRDYLPEALRWLGELIPVTAAMDVIRGVFTGGTGLDPARLGVAVLIALGYAAAGLLTMPWAERRAMERSF